MTGAPQCQGCGAALVHTLVDLGRMPLANSFTDDRVEYISAAG